MVNDGPPDRQRTKFAESQTSENFTKECQLVAANPPPYPPRGQIFATNNISLQYLSFGENMQLQEFELKRVLSGPSEDLLR